MEVEVQAQPVTMDNIDKHLLKGSVPALSSYLYQNFLLPAFSPNLATQWLASPFANDVAQPASADYFSQNWANTVLDQKLESVLAQSTANALRSVDLTASPSNTESSLASTSAPVSNSDKPRSASLPSYSMNPYPQQFYFSTIPTSLLPNASQPSSLNQVYTLPSHSLTVSPEAIETELNQSSSSTPISMPQSLPPSPRRRVSVRPKRPKRSLDVFELDMSDAEASHDDEQEHEGVPEGVERNGMIWGMKVEDYRALSARERKRVRNRISARTFRAKRKEHLSSLETTLNTKDAQIKHASEETARLRREVADLKRRLAKYENL